ncbi:unnamed protein product [Hermetia illucens]|uniref:Alpha-1,3-glucosyltransferase n=1 Tax=Hermetia illucens TaxID=343691 RepID=A0A7R8V2G6_HERIL|nr:probable dolichyl pyrophosphate Glc1Man9GlcNAc2 alpha-1,3-glucosyltransferase [Hermetia illucens]CAD7090990.1 unnamed protein product [Hermetia illucens]
MFWPIFVLMSGVKLLFVPAYHSTDFEVHRNWLAITHSLPICKWYFEDTSEWTLDYPPFFAYFEYVLSQIAKWFDPEMLKVENLNYASEATVLFQRLSVIVTDLIYALGVKMCLKPLNLNHKHEKTIVAALLLANAGLIFVDHIHFQYNGFLFGVLLLSIGFMLREQFLMSALLFCILLNLKHIFIYIAPAYGAYLLKFYCWQRKQLFVNLLKLLVIAFATVAVSFGPFLDQIPQVLSRLFPFKRGLTHAYWAPNFWALYNFADKTGSIVYKVNRNESSFTGGLVQEYDHNVLPTIRPLATFIITAVFMVPCVLKLLFGSLNNKGMDFIRAVVLCSTTSFMFGWHVHEKAILMTLIPLSLLATKNINDCKSTIFLGAIGYYSLFPLLFRPELLLVKVSYYLAYMLLSWICLKHIHRTLHLNIVEILYIFGLSSLLVYEHCVQYLIGFDKKLPFLPLLMTSVYCALGVLYFFCQYYVRFLLNTEIVHRSSKHKHKTK